MLKNCGITFHNCFNGVFLSGNAVAGTINLQFDRPKKVTGISLNISGKGVCRWSENSGTGKNRRSRTYSTNEIYLQTYSDLLPAENNNYEGGKTTLQVGNHSFDFTFLLPPSLPSSHEGSYGSVRYAAKVVMRRKHKADLVHKVSFTVLTNIDLNLNPHFRVPVKLEIDKNFTFLFTYAGKLTMVIELPITGYVPGENIILKCHLHNVGKVSLQEIKLSLLQNMIYRAMSPYANQKTLTFNLAKSNAAVVQTGETFAGELALKIPAIPPSSLPGYSAIDRQYMLKITVVVSGMHSNVKAFIPITIGTIPFHENGPQADASSAISSPASSSYTSHITTQYLPTPQPIPTYSVHSLNSSNNHLYMNASNTNIPNMDISTTSVLPPYLDAPPTYEEAQSSRAYAHSEEDDEEEDEEDEEKMYREFSRYAKESSKHSKSSFI